MSVEDSNFQSSSNERLLRYISSTFISVVKQLCHVTAFSLKHLSMVTGNFELIVAQALQGYVCLLNYDTGYSPKKCSET